MPIDGRQIHLAGRPLLHLGSCSYLGLERDSRLIAGAQEATARYGTQFSASRFFASIPLYEELESLLTQITGAPVLVAATTTLAHASILPQMVREEDAVLYDQQVHTSVQQALNHLRVYGIPTTSVRHNRLDLLEVEIRARLGRNPRIWYMIDGVYSIFGDLAPYSELLELLDRYPTLWLYIDDAHGISCQGMHGRGFALDWLLEHPRVVVAGSMAKGFGASGGFLVIKDDMLRQRVRRVGTSFTFSGPLPPPVVGAAVASAKIHLSPEIEIYQAELHRLIDLCSEHCKRLALPLTSTAKAAVRFIGLGQESLTRRVAVTLQERGYFTNPVVFPIVPSGQSGIRFTLTRHLAPADLVGFLETLREVLDEALAAEGRSMDEILETFSFLEGLPGRSSEQSIPPPLPAPSPGLTLETSETIQTISPTEWDSRFGTTGIFNHEGLQALEAIFHPGRQEVENRWHWRYYTVKDAQGAVVAQTFFTLSLWKDDMVAPGHVSRLIEAERTTDPLHMTSMVYALGCNLTNGEHLYLDRSGPWKEALRLLLRQAQADQSRFEAPLFVLRDFSTEDPELDTLLLEDGFIRFPMPPSADVHVRWHDDAEHLSVLTRQPRKHQRRAVLPFDESYAVHHFTAADLPALSDDFWKHLYSLYIRLQGRKFDYNTFPLPVDFFPTLLESPAWEMTVLYPADIPDGPPAAFYMSFKGPKQYVPLVGGYDEHYREQGAYRQMLRRAIQRGVTLDKQRVLLGFDSTFEKTRFGATVRESVFYIRTSDTFRLERLAEKFTAAPYQVLPEAAKDRRRA